MDFGTLTDMDPRSFVNSYAYNKALIDVEQIIEILGNDPIALVHAMVYLQRIFKDLCLDGQEFVSHDLEKQRNAVAVIRRVVVIAFLLGLKYSHDECNLMICDNWSVDIRIACKHNLTCRLLGLALWVSRTACSWSLSKWRPAKSWIGELASPRKAGERA